MPDSTNFFQAISMSLGLPSEVIEIAFILFFIILLLFLIFVPITMVSIRKELSGINWKLGYIARFLKREMEEQKKMEAAKEDQWQF
jgi:hypothetical protein